MAKEKAPILSHNLLAKIAKKVTGTGFEVIDDIVEETMAASPRIKKLVKGVLTTVEDIVYEELPQLTLPRIEKAKLINKDDLPATSEEIDVKAKEEPITQSTDGKLFGDGD
jgi:hypothetical protein